MIIMYKAMNRKNKKRTICAADAKPVKKATVNTHRIVPAPYEQSDVMRELRDVPLLHYLFKIKNFSQLSNASADNFESAEFSVGGYNWKLSLYPRGNKKVGEKDHISLYLVLCKSKGFVFKGEVNVYLKLFVYNHVLDKYLAVQDAKGSLSCFHSMKRECGFHQLVPLSVFNDPSNGYLVDDCCAFGAEVFVLEGPTRGETVKIVKELYQTHAWEIEDFIELADGISEEFFICGYKWTLKLHPYGYFYQKGKSVSAFLALDDSEPLKPGHGLYVEFVLRVRDQVTGNHHERSERYRFSSSSRSRGVPDLIPLGKLYDSDLGFINNGTVILEVQISQISKVKELS